MSDDARQLKRYRVKVSDPETGDSREFPWLPAYSPEGAIHQGKVQLMRTPLIAPEDVERYDRLDAEVSEIPQG